MHLRPDPVVTPEDIEHGKRMLVRDAAFASLTGALSGGVVLVGFALELGASPTIVGLLASIPFLAQVVQLPAIALVERIRQRRKIAVLATVAARAVILSLALLPLLPDRRLQLTLLVGAQAVIPLLGSIAGCAINSWLHQLLPKEGLGAFFAKRLFWSTALGSIGALAAGQLVDQWPFGPRIEAYSWVFVAAGLAGFASSLYLVRTPEPPMPDVGPPSPVLAKIGAPFRDGNFRSLMGFMASWQFASNLAAPFISVYLIRQLNYGLSTVTTLWAVSQVANALTLYLWGRLSDRLSNKAILAVALPAYFGGLFGLVVVALPTQHGLTLLLLYLFHIIMGAASGGIGLATGNVGLKLAPPGQGTAYLACVGLVGSAAGAVAPIIGGVLADWFASRQFSLAIHWIAPGTVRDVTLLQFRHWEFLFAISAALGMYVLHRLSKIQEGRDISERVVLQQFVLEALRTIEQLSPIDGLRTTLFSPGRLVERRRKRRGATQPAPSETT
jgi:MFS family permease